MTISIENSTTRFAAGPDREGEFLSRAEVLAFVVGSVPPDKGATYAEIYRRGKIVDLLESSNGTIELSDKQLAVVKSAFESHRWPVASRDILEIGEALGVTVDPD